MRALAKDPAQRHPSAHYFAASFAHAATASLRPGWLSRTSIQPRLSTEVREAAEGQAIPPLAALHVPLLLPRHPAPLDPPVPLSLPASQAPPTVPPDAAPFPTVATGMAQSPPRSPQSPGWSPDPPPGPAARRRGRPFAALSRPLTAPASRQRRFPRRPWIAAVALLLAAVSAASAVVVTRPDSRPNSPKPRNVIPTLSPRSSTALATPSPVPAKLKHLATLAGHDGRVLTASFSPDSTVIATAGADDTVILWSLSDPSLPTRVKTISEQVDDVSTIVFSAHQPRLFTSGRRAVRWDFTNSTSTWEILSTDLPSPSSLAVSRDDSSLAMAGGFKVAVLDLVADPPVPAPTATLDVTKAIGGLAFTPDLGMLASSHDGLLALWDTSTAGRAPRIATLPSGLRLDDIFKPKLTFSPNGRMLAVGTLLGFEIWDVEEPRRPARVATNDYTRKGYYIHSLAFSPDSLNLAVAVTSVEDPRVKLTVWDVANPVEPVRYVETSHNAGVECVVFSPNGKNIAVAGRDGTVSLWAVV